MATISRASLCEPATLRRNGDMFQEVLTMSREIGDRHLEGFVLYNLGRVASQQGDLIEGQHKLEPSLSIRQQISDKEHVAYVERTGARIACTLRELISVND